MVPPRGEESAVPGLLETPVSSRFPGAAPPGLTPLPAPRSRGGHMSPGGEVESAQRAAAGSTSASPSPRQRAGLHHGGCRGTILLRPQPPRLRAYVPPQGPTFRHASLGQRVLLCAPRGPRDSLRVRALALRAWLRLWLAWPSRSLAW